MQLFTFEKEEIEKRLKYRRSYRFMGALFMLLALVNAISAWYSYSGSRKLADEKGISSPSMLVPVVSLKERTAPNADQAAIYNIECGFYAAYYRASYAFMLLVISLMAFRFHWNDRLLERLYEAVKKSSEKSSANIEP